MDRELLEDLHQYFDEKKDITLDERLILCKLKGELPKFQMMSISRENLTALGFKTEDVDDCDMKTLASKLADDYCEQMFDISLEIIAEEGMEIPKHLCPKCWKGASKYDSYDKQYTCRSCDHEWSLTDSTGRYVLIESSEDASFFEENEIGYESYISNCLNARYVPEHLYVAHFEREPRPSVLRTPIKMPEAQRYRELKQKGHMKYKQCEDIIGGRETVEFGEGSIWVPTLTIKNKE